MFGRPKKPSVRVQLAELTSMVREIARTQRITMSQLDDVLAAIDSATTDIGSKLDAENSTISSVASDMSALRSQLSSAPTVTQAVLDRLTAAASKLTGASTTIAEHTAALQAIAADPANPVPTAPPAAMPAV